MTIKDLSQYRYLRKEIEKDTEKLVEFTTKAKNVGTSVITSRIGGSTDISDKVGLLVSAIVDLEAEIFYKKIKALKELTKLYRFINKIDDSQIRLIVQLRFAEEITWQEVATGVGGNNTEDSVKKRCYRFLSELK